MQLLLDRDGKTPLHRQIEAQIRSLIQDGDLVVGSRLPATRGLARNLGVNRSTVCTAYDALAAYGFVEARVGQGTRVISRGPLRERPPAATPPSRPDWTGLLADGLDALSNQIDAPCDPAARLDDSIDFTGIIPDERFFPVDRLRRCLDDVLRREGVSLLQYGSTRGYQPFRDIIAQRMRLSGNPVAAEEVLVVNGAQQGLELFCKALLDPGDAVVVESPTYGNLLSLLRLYRAEVVSVPMTPEGLDLRRLETLLQRRRVKFLYTMPHFQNPTGVTSSQQHRKRLLEMAAEHDLAILEDGFEEELRWDGGEVLPLRALDRHGRVCYVGTFSKGLCPGFRIGWLVADTQLGSHLEQLKRATDFHSSVLLQATLAEFCRRGEYDKHLRRLRRVYRARMARTASALQAHMPAGTRWRIPAGGYCVWLELPHGVSETEIVARVARDAVHVSPGRHFFPTDPGYGCVRLSISRVNEEEIDGGLAVVGRHLHVLAREARRADSGSNARPYI
jgi:DNA-binding transcriptional MocR family regulator